VIENLTKPRPLGSGNPLTDEWLVRLSHFSRLWVGYSGGLDSTVLLHCFMRVPELANKLSAIHVHHGLSVHADEWRAHCEAFCAHHAIALQVRFVELNHSANIEEQARVARFNAFASLVGKHDALLLAHHADDQAETVLLQLMRGAGVDGLAAMSPITSWSHATILRPFLQHTRATLEAYAITHHLSWIDDDSNDNVAFSRNYLRHDIMPLLKARWPGAVGNLVRTATHCQQAKTNLQDLAYQDCPELLIRHPEKILRAKRRAQDDVPLGVSDQDDATLSLNGLQSYSFERLANVLRTWIASHHLKSPSTQIFNQLITQVYARADANVCVQWDDIVIRRYQNRLYLSRPHRHCESPTARNDGVDEWEWSNFPNKCLLPQYNSYLSTVTAETGLYIPSGCRITVRFRQGGESFFYRGQRKVLKKLLQQWQVPPWERDRIPLIWIDNELAAVVGFAISDTYYRESSEHLYYIEHICHDH
jgi:tRNA(Ile)-lysidine synthase